MWALTEKKDAEAYERFIWGVGSYLLLMLGVTVVSFQRQAYPYP